MQGNAFLMRVKIKSYHHMSHSFSGTLIPKSNTSKLRGFCLFFVFSSHSWRCCVNVTIFPSVDRYWRNLFQDLMLMEMDGWSELWKTDLVFLFLCLLHNHVQVQKWFQLFHLYCCCQSQTKDWTNVKIVKCMTLAAHSEMFLQVILVCINYCFNIYNCTFVAWGSFQNSLEKLCQLLHLEIL